MLTVISNYDIVLKNDTFEKFFLSALIHSHYILISI